MNKLSLVVVSSLALSLAVVSGAGCGGDDEEATPSGGTTGGSGGASAGSSGTGGSTAGKGGSTAGSGGSAAGAGGAGAGGATGGSGGSTSGAGGATAGAGGDAGAGGTSAGAGGTSAGAGGTSAGAGGTSAGAGGSSAGAGGSSAGAGGSSAGAGGSSAGAGGSSAGSAGAGGCVDLTVKNTLVWCSISVNGMPASAAAEQKVCVPPGDVEVTATPLGGFKLGDWHHTSGDTGNGEPGMISGGASKAKVVVGASGACAWICCPFLNGSGCPTTDQCP